MWQPWLQTWLHCYCQTWTKRFVAGKNASLDHPADLQRQQDGRQCKHGHRCKHNRRHSATKLPGPQQCRDVIFGSKVGHISPKWDKFGTLSDQISVHFGSQRTEVNLCNSTENSLRETVNAAHSFNGSLHSQGFFFIWGYMPRSQQSLFAL